MSVKLVFLLVKRIRFTCVHVTEEMCRLMNDYSGQLGWYSMTLLSYFLYVCMYAYRFDWPLFQLLVFTLHSILMSDAWIYNDILMDEERVFFLSTKKWSLISKSLYCQRVQLVVSHILISRRWNWWQFAIFFPMFYCTDPIPHGNLELNCVFFFISWREKSSHDPAISVDKQWILLHIR